MKKTLESLNYALFWQILGWLMLAVVTGLSLTPSPPAAPALLGWDKAQHLAAYGTLMYWFGMAFSRHWRWPALLLVWGVLMEVIQGMGGIRTLDPYDMVANGLGVAAALIVLQTPCARFLRLLERAIPPAGSLVGR